MSKFKILFLAADPSDSSRLRLGQELRDIRAVSQQSHTAVWTSDLLMGRFVHTRMSGAYDPSSTIG